MKQVRVYQNSTLLVNQPLVVDEQTQVYLTKVLRLSDGFTLTVFNGDGFNYRASLSIDKKYCTLNILSKHPNHTEIQTNVCLVQAIAKRDKMDSIVQKATELGVYHIVPLITERVVVKLSTDKQLTRQTHWQKVAISACEQCGRSIIPTVSSPLTLNQFVQNNTGGFVLDPRAETTLSDYKQTTAVNLLVGPEGGLTEDEIAHAQTHNYQPLSIAKTTLRTETAGLAALAQLSLLWG